MYSLANFSLDEYKKLLFSYFCAVITKFTRSPKMYKGPTARIQDTFPQVNCTLC